jgi:hypothetical protein
MKQKTDTVRDTLALLGSGLIVVQAVEHLLAKCMSMALPKTANITREVFQKQSAEEAKRTLGQLLIQLRLRIVVKPEFDAALMKFLDLRNSLVHRIQEVEGIDFHTPQGRAVARAFIETVIDKGRFLIKIFSGLLRAWAQQVGLKLTDDDPQRDYYREIDALYQSQIHELLESKPTTPPNLAE